MKRCRCGMVLNDLVAICPKCKRKFPRGSKVEFTEPPEKKKDNWGCTIIIVVLALVWLANKHLEREVRHCRTCACEEKRR